MRFSKPWWQKVLLPKTFLDTGFYVVVIWKSLASKVFLSVCQTLERRQRDVSFRRQALESLIARYDKSLNEFGDCVGKQRTDVRIYPWASLVSTHFNPLKEIRNVTF
jgi:hypothetical protein